MNQSHDSLCEYAQAVAWHLEARDRFADAVVRSHRSHPLYQAARQSLRQARAAFIARRRALRMHGQPSYGQSPSWQSDSLS